MTAIVPLQILDKSPTYPQNLAFLTGSYDEHVRLFTLDKSMPHRCRVVAEMKLGGGVWRLRKLSESYREAVVGEGDMRVQVCDVLILASCMHAGVRVLRVTRRESSRKDDEDWCKWEIDVIGSFTEGHESMCYGADAVNVSRLAYSDGVEGGKPSRSLFHERYAPGEFVVVSTSFYDRKICVWSFWGETNAIDESEEDSSKACLNQPCERRMQQEMLDKVY